MLSNNKTPATTEFRESPILPTRSLNNKPIETTEMDLNTLFKFIKPYDGCREKLNSFIVNCDNAIALATETQEPILFKFILSRLDGKAETACSIKDFMHWFQLKHFLKEQFCERKHYSHLLADIQESRQGPLETVNQFALKLETCLSQLMAEISLSTSEHTEITGRIAAMEDLALHHFIMGLKPHISTIVRCRSPNSLNEAINVAISEERIQQAVYRRSQPAENKGRNFPSRNSFPAPARPNFGQRPTNYGQNNNSAAYPQIICRYCKNIGHNIENCKKREYNNNRFRNQQPNSQPNRNPNPFPRPGQNRIHFTQCENAESRDETDSIPGNDIPNHLNY